MFSVNMEDYMENENKTEKKRYITQVVIYYTSEYFWNEKVVI